MSDRANREHVYIVSSPAQCAFKVGYSSGAPRIHSLQTGNPDGLRVELCVRAGRDVEQAMHESLVERRIRGEWFRGDDGFVRLLVWSLLDQAREPEAEERAMTPEEAVYAVDEAIRDWSEPVDSCEGVA